MHNSPVTQKQPKNQKKRPLADTQIQSKLAAATVAAIGEVPAVGATGFLCFVTGELSASIISHGPWFFFFSCFLWVTGELSTLRQMMKVPNEPGLSPNNGPDNVFLSDQDMASNPRKGQAKRFGAKTTSHDGKAGHVMTHVCHCARQERHKTKNVRWKHPDTPDLMSRWMRPYKG